MFDAHTQFKTFYNKHVKLDNIIDNELREYRDKNVERLKKGLTTLGHNLPEKARGQGSYSMRTMVRQPNNDYDIDHAIIFRAEDLPDDPLEARNRVIDGLCASGDTHLFSKSPQRRTNAITVWYEAGYHVDLAVYRCFEGAFGKEVTQHAGTKWRERNPVAMNEWFRKQVDSKSPHQDNNATVDEKQMSRIVQFLKMFTKARTESMPGGLITSVLVSENYIPDYDRDDLALVNTMRSIRDNTRYNFTVRNPVDRGYELTEESKRKTEVKNFHNILDEALTEWLAPLFKSNCDNEKAFKAWNKVFKHEYWKALLEGLEASVSPKFVSSTGSLSFQKPSEAHIESPPHKFFGDE